jgi:ATP-dependent RNA helicase DeaD
MKTFDELAIAPEIIRAVTELGFKNPMPVQEQVIPHLLNKETDIIALAQTGTGKTAAFGLPVIQQIDLKINQPQVLIMCPTRELCMQITGDLTDFSKYIAGLKVLPVYGGASMETQIRGLQKGVHIIVATPGRLLDLMSRKVVKLNHVSKVILDEADEMLNMGFSESINDILSQLPKERNTLLFSATMPPEISKIAHKYMNNPVEITIGRKNEGAENVSHVCYMVQARDKYLTLKRLADYYPNIYGIVFCRTRRETQEIADKLITDGYNAEALHGDLSQSQRDYVMQKFRVKNLQLLVATDVAARGIDVDDLTHIINYNLPDDPSAYTHRSGRTGRAGKTGISIVIANLKEKHFIRQIENKIGKQFEIARVPEGKEVCEKQLFHLVDKLEKVEVEHSGIEPYLPMILKKLEWMEKEDLLKRLVSLEFNRFLDYYKNARDLNQRDESSPRRTKNGAKKDFRSTREIKDYGTFSNHPSSTRMFINIGKVDGIYPNTLIDLVKKQMNGNKVKIGKIQMMNRHSIFEVENMDAHSMIHAFGKAEYDNRTIFLKPDGDKPEGPRTFKKMKKRARV